MPLTSRLLVGVSPHAGPAMSCILRCDGAQMQELHSRHVCGHIVVAAVKIRYTCQSPKTKACRQVTLRAAVCVISCPSGQLSACLD